MKTSLKWIKALVPGIEDVTAQEYADAMTMSGTKVEMFEEMDRDLNKIVVGKIDSIEKHPDADKLIVCQVDVGESEDIQIVTGAKNVSEGDKVPVVLVGGRVAGSHDGKMTPGGIKIKKGKLRGVESFGMMCSIEELGSNTDMYPEAPEDGIYIFGDDVNPGDDAIKLLGRDDVVVEYEITSNRVDCFSVLGIAREAAATFNKEFKPPVVTETGNDEDASDYISVEIENPKYCRRFCARVVKNIKVAPSPEWMQRRLSAQGIRPINNIVDITNYVMEEYGQPMHAYDLDTIEDRKIVVRNASEGEKFVTLDGQERVLDETMTMICDGKKAVGIGGIMGGENSMITDNVSTMLFEAACFDGANIRVSAKKLGMRTEASAIFEKGLDPENAILAINRACQLIEELGAGEVVGGCVDVYPLKGGGRRLPFEPDKYNKLLGTDIDRDTQLEYLSRLEIEYDKENNELVIPSFRQDLLSYADISEEVARFFGYDKIPTTLPGNMSGVGQLSPKLAMEVMLRNIAEYCGFSQSMTYSFESPKVFDKLRFGENSTLRKAITISNPLGEDFSIMRTSVLNGMLTSLATNYSRRNKNVRLYELGNIYIPKELPLKELPDERMQLVFGFYGEGDFFNMKGVVEEVFDKLGMNHKSKYIATTEIGTFHPGRSAFIMYDEVRVGFIGEVHPSVLKAYGIKARTYIANLDVMNLLKLAVFDKKYEGIANFPAANRDLSMVVPRDISAGKIEEVFDENGGEYLEHYELFDIYEGEQVAEGFKSMAYSLRFRAKDRNLNEKDITQAMDSILSALEKIGIELRK